MKRIINRLDFLEGLILGFFFACFILLILVPIIKRISYKKQVVKSSDYYTTQLFERNPQICDIDSEGYYKMSLAEKQQLLQSIANMETEYLGCQQQVVIAIKELDDTLGGEYDNSIYQITLNKKLVERDSLETLGVLLHEIYHHYQEQCLEDIQLADINSDLLFFRNMRYWYEDLSNYSEADTIAQYNSLTYERDAEKYSRERITDYFAYFMKEAIAGK